MIKDVLKKNTPHKQNAIAHDQLKLRDLVGG